MVATTEFSVKHAFVLEPEEVRKVCRLLQDRIGSTSISSQCADGITREFADISQLLGYENPRRRRIASISFRSHSDDWKKQADISFSSHSWATISANFSGLEASVMKLRDEISEMIDGLKPWYWRFARIDFFIVALITWFGADCILTIYANGQAANSVKPAVNLVKAFSITGIVLAALGIVVLSFWGLHRLRSRYFPLAVFKIGQETRRFDTDGKVRWTIMIGFTVSLVASLIVAAWRG
jgi:hypothetical protein